ncbi:MAG: RpiB/LacA/LacB family sugar-phosphate isomerase, partial [Anaerolineales bacterium]
RAEYPDVAARVARAVSRGDADAGIVIDAGGIGPAIAANKIAGVRAAMADSERTARYAREHHGANVLTLGAAFLSVAEATAIVVAWLTTSMRDPKAIARLSRIRDLEQR